MKDKKKKHAALSMKFFFVMMVIIIILLVVASASGLMELLHSAFEITRDMPDIFWIGILSALLGIVAAIFLRRFFFTPFNTIGAAMSKVAKGDFSIKLDTTKGFAEMRRMNADFNRMTEELRATEILQTDFVSNVSHEFKTPINAIEGYATLLQGSDSTVSEEQAEYIEKILFNTQRLSTLVGNILLLSKVDSQGITAKRERYRLDEQIRQSILSLEPRWLEKETEFEVDLESVEYVGNEPLMSHVWNNLIENAIKFGPRGGVVRLKLTSLGGMICFTIEDNGPGIDEDAKKHIFDRFYQTDSSHKSEGNGLGLALVKQILIVEKGEITVENIPEGGCKFTVMIPQNII